MRNQKAMKVKLKSRKNKTVKTDSSTKEAIHNSTAKTLEGFLKEESEKIY